MSTADGRLRVFVSDLFKVDRATLFGDGKSGDGFDAVFDRGSFGAVYKEDREQYAK